MHLPSLIKNLVPLLATSVGTITLNTSMNLALIFQSFSGSSLQSMQLFPHCLTLNNSHIV